jgi:hypothetical protein
MVSIQLQNSDLIKVWNLLLKFMRNHLTKNCVNMIETPRTFNAMDIVTPKEVEFYILSRVWTGN